MTAIPMRQRLARTLRRRQAACRAGWSFDSTVPADGRQPCGNCKAQKGVNRKYVLKVALNQLAHPLVAGKSTPGGDGPRIQEKMSVEARKPEPQQSGQDKQAPTATAPTAGPTAAAPAVAQSVP